MRREDALLFLAHQYPQKGMVDFGTAEDTLIATLLSARTRDEQVLRAYPGLRKAFPTLEDFARATPKKIEPYISTIGLYPAKAKAIHGLAKILLEDYGGEVPRTMEDLLRLPGVGRKTASCVLAYAFKIPAIAVDTHVYRIARRLGWAKGDTPERVEVELKKAFPQPLWFEINRALIPFGREVCKPIKPLCWKCPLASVCPFPEKTPPPKMVY